ncbi:MAG TPA: universal stress protein [Puia sp.]|nr:universal stress protein [Puia sp.]
MPVKNILLLVSDSPESRKAAKFGFELARTLNAAAALVFVVDKSHEMVNPDLGVSLEQKRAAMLKAARATIAQLTELYAAGSEVLQFIPEGRPGIEIIKVAAEWPADLIVMGTHLHGRIELLLQGSLTEYIIRHATVPVIVAPPAMR